MKKHLFFLLFLLFGVIRTYATHNRAGEITYEFISGTTYKITVTTYTKESSAAADRCKLTVYFGDGDSTDFQRSNGSTINIDGDQACPYYGESLGNDIKKNIYEGYHTYPGAGSYIISMADPNRNSGICNIPNSVNTSFYIQSELVINPFLGPCSSPVLLNPPIDNACVGKCFKHNPGAYDVNDDSLSYSLVNCYADGSQISGYTLPPNMSYSNIDALKGDLVWCAPSVVCQYNIAILIKFYRRLPGNSKRYYIGSILRDMQIDVNTCVNNPPQIKNINDTCISAENNLHFGISASDPGYIVTLNATGGPMISTPAATFMSSPSLSPATGVFDWTPNCTQVQLLPYLVTFKATDNSPDTTADYKSVFIRVIAPAPTGLTATPSGSSILLNWNPAFCNSTLGSNPLVSYLIYRKNSCDNWTHNVCETGVPSSSGYTQIGSTPPTVTTFTDNNNGQGLTYGVNYSYMIVATYNDGSQSYATRNVCAVLKRDVPIITNVSVVSTGSNDSIWIHWILPITTSGNLDTIAYPPPYKTILMQTSGVNPSASSFTQVASYNYSSFWQMTDTGYVSTGLNTIGSAYTYRVDFYSNGTLVGSTNTASSVYLSSSPANKKVILSWQAIVPWNNYKYFIYKETTPNSNIFNLIDSTTTATYIDSIGLYNRKTYCYKIISVGDFSDTTIIHPLYNNSQIKCEIPIDTVPPCQPTITSITGNCETAGISVTWLNPNTYCSKEAATYRLYFCSYLQ